MGVLIFLATALAMLLAVLTALLLYEMLHPPRHTAGYALAKGLPADPGELGMAFDEWRLDRPDGAHLPVWEIAGERDSGGFTVIFVHGWGHSRIDMLPQARHWHAHAHRLVFFDQRGHGESSGPTSQLGHAEVDDLLALLDRLGDDRIVLVGFSMGAVIALATAASGDPRAGHLSGIVALGPYVEFHRSLIGRLHRHHLPARPMTDLVLQFLTLAGRPPRSVKVAELQRIACPVLVVHGKADIVAPIDHSRTIATHLRSGEFIALPEIDHVLTDLISDEQYLEALRGFLARLHHV